MGSTYVVSDVHGHLDDLRAALRGAGLVADGDRWCGDDATLWVLGDMGDRGPDGIGVIRLLRGLQQQAPERVRVLLGNHESLMIGQRLFPGSRFTDVWAINGGLDSDQDGLTDGELGWLRTLPAMGRSGGHLLVHSDTTDYLGWGEDVDTVNATVSQVLAGDDADQHFDVFAALTSRYDFAGGGGADAARRVLEAYGGDVIVHGHSMIGTLIDVPSPEIEGPISYADGHVVAIDGGRYDGGPLLLVRLD
ncbi:MAG: serine/threonine protein phosphatase [Nocardioidaceae bacterium]|nr:serine/threonine protein phosphatase [Nocardioidaceae bacterium]